MSKGSNRRPQDVPDKDVAEAWRRIFNPPQKPAEPEPQPEEQDDGR